MCFMRQNLTVDQLELIHWMLPYFFGFRFELAIQLGEMKAAYEIALEDQV